MHKFNLTEGPRVVFNFAEKGVQFQTNALFNLAELTVQFYPKYS